MQPTTKTLYPEVFSQHISQMAFSNRLMNTLHLHSLLFLCSFIFFPTARTVAETQGSSYFLLLLPALTCCSYHFELQDAFTHCQQNERRHKDQHCHSFTPFIWQIIQCLIYWSGFFFSCFEILYYFQHEKRPLTFLNQNIKTVARFPHFIV